MKKLGFFLILGLTVSFVNSPLLATTKTVVPGTQSTPTTTAAEDASIISDLQGKLSQDKALVGTSITITSDGGVVSLTGNVDTQAQADAAILEAKSVPGVKDVKSDIRVKQGISVNTIGPATPAPK